MISLGLFVPSHFHPLQSSCLFVCLLACMFHFPDREDVHSFEHIVAGEERKTLSQSVPDENRASA